MIIIGCDFHTRFQQIAMLDPTTGELIERRLAHETSEARSFYASLSEPARVGIEATGNAQWFEKVLREYHHKLRFRAGAHIPKKSRLLWALVFAHARVRYSVNCLMTFEACPPGPSLLVPECTPC